MRGGVVVAHAIRALFATAALVATTSCVDTAKVGTMDADAVAPARFAVTPAALSSSTPVRIAGKWRFHLGDDPQWAHPDFDDDGWDVVDVPNGIGAQGHADYAGFFW